MATTVKSETGYVNYVEFSGDTLKMSFLIQPEGGPPIDFTSHTAKMDIKLAADDVTPQLTLTDQDGIVLSAGDPNVDATVTDIQTLALGVNDFVFDIEFRDLSGHVNTYVSGCITLEQGVTDPL